MPLFEKKKILPTKRVCLRLKEAREAAHLSLRALSQKTKIQPEFLQALEECRFTDLPVEPVYLSLFIRSYVKALGLSADSFLKQYNWEEEKTTPEFSHPLPSLKAKSFHNWPLFLRFSTIIILTLGFITYLGMQIKHIIDPPQLVLYSPMNGLITTNDSITIQGKTEDYAAVSINGKQVVSNDDGHFLEHVDLSLGVNTIIVEAKKRHGKTSTETRHVVLRAVPNQVTLTSPPRLP